MYNCWYCGQEVAWVGDSMESEVDGSCDYPENDRVVGYYHCSACGSDYEFRQGSREDYETSEEL